MMMSRSVSRIAYLAGVCILAGATACALQAQAPARPASVSTDLAITYAAERAEIAPGDCGCFWLQGGGADAAITFSKGLGIAASLNGSHASNFAPGVDVNRVAFMAGPRYTHWIHTGTAGSQQGRGMQFFGEGLFGGERAFNGVFPASSGVTSSANAFAMQTGGGFNLLLSKSFGLRLLQVDYARTTLPNNASNTENDLRLAFGVIWRIGRR
ncbi:MAG: hypothetical protein ABR898_01335 [Terracidiphilus sp.]|jgi:hypothetical protein